MYLIVMIEQCQFWVKMVILTWKIGTTYQKYIKTLMMLSEPGSFITTSANEVTCQAVFVFFLFVFLFNPMKFSRSSFIVYLMISYKQTSVLIIPDSFGCVLAPSSEVSLGVDVSFMVSCF